MSARALDLGGLSSPVCLLLRCVEYYLLGCTTAQFRPWWNWARTNGPLSALDLGPLPFWSLDVLWSPTFRPELHWNFVIGEDMNGQAPSLQPGFLVLAESFCTVMFITTGVDS